MLEKTKRDTPKCPACRLPLVRTDTKAGGSLARCAGLRAEFPTWLCRWCGRTYAGVPPRLAKFRCEKLGRDVPLHGCLSCQRAEECAKEMAGG